MEEKIKDILISWREEQERHLAEDFESFEEMKKQSEEFEDLKEINIVRTFLGEPLLSYDDFFEDYKNLQEEKRKKTEIDEDITGERQENFCN